jgi:CysZ protein
VVRGFVSGVRMLLRGFGYWRRDPGVMLLGLVPAVLVFAGIVAALVALGFGLPALVDWATPFADDWQAGWRTAFRITVGAITFTAAGLLAAVTFTAVTLAVGDPFYERIWRSVELDLGGDVPAEGAGFWRAVVDSLGLIGLGLVAAIVVALVGFIPVVGAVAAPVLGVVLSGRLLAAELSSRALQARGLPADVRRAIRRAHRGELLGFGVATQLCFMIPLGAVFTMPAAVAGSTMLARSALDAVQPAPAVGPVGPAPAAGPAAGPTATDVSAS